MKKNKTLMITIMLLILVIFTFYNTYKTTFHNNNKLTVEELQNFLDVEYWIFDIPSNKYGGVLFMYTKDFKNKKNRIVASRVTFQKNYNDLVKIISQNNSRYPKIKYKTKPLGLLFIDPAKFKVKNRIFCHRTKQSGTTLKSGNSFLECYSQESIQTGQNTFSSNPAKNKVVLKAYIDYIAFSKEEYEKLKSGKIKTMDLLNNYINSQTMK